MTLNDDWLCISLNADNMLDDIYLHDIVVHLFNALSYLNLLMSYYCFALVLCCCELASTFNVLTWRVMPGLQTLLWTRRTTFPVFAS